VTLFLGSVIALVANQSPTVVAGSAVNVITPKGEDNYRVEV
jgi:hypothetical protein